VELAADPADQRQLVQAGEIGRELRQRGRWIIERGDASGRAHHQGPRERERQFVGIVAGVAVEDHAVADIDRRIETGDRDGALVGRDDAHDNGVCVDERTVVDRELGLVVASAIGVERRIGPVLVDQEGAGAGWYRDQGPGEQQGVAVGVEGVRPIELLLLRDEAIIDADIEALVVPGVGRGWLVLRRVDRLDGGVEVAVRVGDDTPVVELDGGRARSGGDQKHKTGAQSAFKNVTLARFADRARWAPRSRFPGRASWCTPGGVAGTRRGRGRACRRRRAWWRGA